MNYYPHHIGDYKAATAHLSNDEDLAYRRLLEMYYDTERPIPLETQWVSRRLRLETQPIENVLKDFFERRDDGWHHARCDAEIKEYHRMQEKNRSNGRKGGRPRAAPDKAENPVGSQSVASGNPPEPQSQPTGKATRTRTRTNISTSLRSVDDTVAMLVDLGVTQKNARDWLQTRKDKGAKTLTDTALELVRSEAAKAGISLDLAIKTAAGHGWQGFRAHWYTNLTSQRNGASNRPGSSATPGGRYGPAAAAVFDDSECGLSRPTNHGPEVIDA